MAKNKWDYYVIGVLSSDEDLDEFALKAPVFINNVSALQFSIKMISNPPESFPNVKQFTGYLSNLENSGFQDDTSLTDKDRTESLCNFLEDKLVVFRPEIKHDYYKDRDYYNMIDVTIIEKPAGFTKDTRYIPVPVFNEQDHRISFEDFTAKLLTQKFVGKIENISKELSDTPPLIFWRNRNSQYSIIGVFKKHRYAYGGFQFIKETDIRSCECQEELEGRIIELKNDSSLVFIDKDAHEEIWKRVDEAPLLLDTELSMDDISSHVVNQISEEITFTEIDFIERFVLTSRDMGLLYKKEDMVNFHVAMKSSGLVILSGMSGVGKSKLVHVYKRALQLDESQLVVIPVRPSWNDDSDLIGYVDSIHMVYRPGDSGLINTLIHASQEENQNQIYIVCFDEMNLARVEHYFSQFLSVLEMEPGARKLRLYNDELGNKLYNAQKYPPTVSIGENIMFIGTVNTDESTYHFSDKVLDRANIINLGVQSFAELHGLEVKKPSYPNRKTITLQDFLSFKNESEEIGLTEYEYLFLEEVHNKMYEANPELGIGYRIVRQIDTYLKNLPNNEELTRDRAFDLQVVQRILTKFRGPEDQLRGLIGKWTDSGEVLGGSIWEVIDDYTDLSKFESSKKVLKQKARELKLYGYTF